MSTSFDELIASIEVNHEMAVKKRDKALAEIKATHALAQQEARGNLTPEEDARVEELFATVTRAKAEIEGIAKQLTNARKAKAEEVEIAAASEQRHDTGVQTRAYDQVTRVGREERTYSPEKDKRGALFLRDVGSRFLDGNPEAAWRLSRHMQEERVERAEYLNRAAGTGAFTGLTVPQYLTDLYAPKVQAMRPFADICNKHDLPPDGMTINISRITTGTSTALQASENSNVSETDMDDTLLTESVQTAAGQQTLSRQAIDRGTGIEDVTMQDLFASYATTLDSTLINQSTTGLAAQAVTTSYTDATPTAAELYPKFHAAMAGVEAALLGKAIPSHAVMHSRRWYWQQSQVGTSWPFMAQPGIPTQAGAVNDGAPYGGVRGLLPNGVKAVVDNNIATNGGAGTNEDAIFVVAADECHLWEDPNAPVFIRAEQAKAASLGVLLVLYGYFAYSFRRYPGAVQSITGTGLITPSF